MQLGDVSIWDGAGRSSWFNRQRHGLRSETENYEAYRAAQQQAAKIRAYQQSSIEAQQAEAQANAEREKELVSQFEEMNQRLARLEDKRDDDEDDPSDLQSQVTASAKAGWAKVRDATKDLVTDGRRRGGSPKSTPDRMKIIAEDVSSKASKVVRDLWSKATPNRQERDDIKDQLPEMIRKLPDPDDMQEDFNEGASQAMAIFKKAGKGNFADPNEMPDGKGDGGKKLDRAQQELMKMQQAMVEMLPVLPGMEPLKAGRMPTMADMVKPDPARAEEFRQRLANMKAGKRSRPTMAREKTIPFVLHPKCKEVELMKTFNVEKYISRPWFTQMMQPTTYQPEDDFRCVRSEYRMLGEGETERERTLDKSLVPTGWTMRFRSFAVSKKGGTVKDSRSFLCGIPEDGDSIYKSQFKFGPCAVPPYVWVGSSYWVLDYDEDFLGGFAIVIGGQPNDPTPDAKQNEGPCNFQTTQLDGKKRHGIWILTRDQKPKDGLVDQVLKKARFEGLDTSKLQQVDHSDCPVELRKPTKTLDYKPKPKPLPIVIPDKEDEEKDGKKDRQLPIFVPALPSPMQTSDEEKDDVLGPGPFSPILSGTGPRGSDNDITPLQIPMSLQHSDENKYGEEQDDEKNDEEETDDAKKDDEEKDDEKKDDEEKDEEKDDEENDDEEKDDEVNIDEPGPGPFPPILAGPGPGGSDENVIPIQTPIQWPNPHEEDDEEKDESS